MAADAQTGAGGGREARSGTGMPEPGLGVERSAPGEGWEQRRHAIVAAVTEGAGPIRAPGPALAALERLDRLDPGPPGADRDALEARTMAVAGRLLVRAALARAESRGTHARSDHPDPDPALEGVHLAW
jgi:succinate dehydrogenase/fumarate reductase flavoprotein subunit